jgi:hypothetical protein
MNKNILVIIGAVILFANCVKAIAVVDINFCTAGGVCHHTDNYWAFLYSLDYWGFLHMYFGFLATYMCVVGLNPRFFAYIWSGLYVMTAATLFSVFQEISVVAYATGSKLPPWNSEWMAGDSFFDLLWTFFGVLFGLFFVFLINALPIVLVSPQPTGKKMKPRDNPWLAWFLWMVLVPVIIISLGIAVIHLVEKDDKTDLLFRSDFLFFAIYMNAILIIHYIIKRFKLKKQIWITAVQLGATGSLRNRPTVTEEEEKILPNAPGDASKRCTMYQIEQAITREFIALLVVSDVMFTIMVFAFLTAFYLQTLIAVGAGLVTMVVVRMVLGGPVKKSVKMYDSELPNVGGWNATRGMPAVGADD